MSVAVVIPAHNAERFLAGALESALRQSYQPLEVLVIDDGSTDSTPEILARYADEVRVHRQPHGGTSAAWK